MHMSSKLNEIMTMNLQNVSDAIIYLSTTLKITTHNLCEQIVTWVMNRSIMILIIGIVISGISLFIPIYIIKICMFLMSACIIFYSIYMIIKCISAPYVVIFDYIKYDILKK